MSLEFAQMEAQVFEGIKAGNDALAAIQKVLVMHVV